MIFDRHTNLKYRYVIESFDVRILCVITVGRNKKVIENYIRNQLQRRYRCRSISMEEYLDPCRKEIKSEKIGTPLGSLGK